MDTLLAIAGEGFVVIAADAQVARSILLYQSNVDKIAPLGEDMLLASGGPQSDCVAFTEYISKNMTLYELNNDVKLNTKAAATFIRGELAKAIRKGPVQAQLLLGGVDKEGPGKGKASLYWMDYLGTQTKAFDEGTVDRVTDAVVNPFALAMEKEDFEVPYGAHGYGANFTLSVMDRDYVKGLTLDEGVAIINKCIHELHTRFLIAQTNFVIKVITAEGVKVIRAPPKGDLGTAAAEETGSPAPVQA